MKRLNKSLPKGRFDPSTEFIPGSVLKFPGNGNFGFLFPGISVSHAIIDYFILAL